MMLWVGGYLLYGVLDHLVRMTVSPFMYRIVYGISEGAANQAVFVNIAIFSTSIPALALLFWIQKRLISRLLNVELHHWIVVSVGAWVLVRVIVFVLFFSTSVLQASIMNLYVLNLLVIFIQWWLLREQVRVAWAWIAGGILVMVAQVGHQMLMLPLYTSVSVTTIGAILFVSSLVLPAVAGVITALVLLWMRRQPDNKRKEDQA